MGRILLSGMVAVSVLLLTVGQGRPAAPQAQYQDCIAKGLDYLAAQQQKDGCWNAPASHQLKARAAAGTSWTITAPETKPAEKEKQDVKVIQLPGGGVEVIIGGKGETYLRQAGAAAQPGGGVKIIIDGKVITERPGQSAPAALEGTRKRLEELLKKMQQVEVKKEAAQRLEGILRQKEFRRPLAQMKERQPQMGSQQQLRERVKRQHELAEQARLIIAKIDALEALGEGGQRAARELWAQLERIQGELRQTVQPSAGGVAPGTWKEMRIEMVPKWIQQPIVQPKVLSQPAKVPPGASWNVVRPDPAIQELRAQVQELRLQMEELRKQLKLISEHKKP